MYPFILALHNIIRWIVLILGLVTASLALNGWLRNNQWSDKDRKIGLFFTTSVDVQLLLGFLLYFVSSEWGLNAILDKGMSFVMGQGEYRFFAIEHATYMLLGFVFAHLGSVLPKKIEHSRRKFKRAAIWYSLAFLIILLGIPWSRPLFP
jgi:hypothetical protein